jgi:hypothetical protein
MCPATDAKVTELAFFITDEITKSILTGFVQSNDFVLI